MILKLKEKIDSPHVLDSLMDNYSNVNVELVSFMMNMKKKYVQWSNFFFLLDKIQWEKNSLYVKPLLLDLEHKNQSYNKINDCEQGMDVVGKYDRKPLFPTCFWNLIIICMQV
jgi:hypothetical protein